MNLLAALIAAALMSSVTLSQIESGQITGAVTDPNGQVVPAAAVVVKSVETGREVTAASNSEGIYTVAALTPGQDVVIVPPKDVRDKLNAPDSKPESSVVINVRGRLRYQACDAKTCYLPEETPVSWELRVHPIDLSRASEAIQDKRN
jgi:hypothetical protein